MQQNCRKKAKSTSKKIAFTWQISNFRSFCNCGNFNKSLATFRSVSVHSTAAFMYLGYFHTIPCSFCNSLRKQPTFQDAKGGFSARWRLRSEWRNSILITSHYLGLYGHCFGLVEICFIQSKVLNPDLDSDALSVWNFCARFSDVIWQVSKW